MTYVYRDKDGKAIGTGDWNLDNDIEGNIVYTGIWKDGYIVALVMAAYEEDDLDFSDTTKRLYKNADEMIARLNRK